MQIRRLHIPFGDLGIERTLREIQRLANEARADPSVIALAHDIVRPLPERQKRLEATTILDFVRAKLRYTDDPFDDNGGKELVKHPRLLVEEIRRHGLYVGDCDDAVMLALSLLGAVGIPSWPVVIDQGTGEYSHVLVAFDVDGQRETFDPIVRGTPVGWFPSGATRVGMMGYMGLREVRR